MQETVNPDWECFAKAQRGDETAWRMLIEQNQARLAAIALFITGSATAAEDVVQETFLRALGAEIRDNAGTVRGFLGTIAYRLALKEAKRLRRNTRLENFDLPDHGTNPLDGVLSDERDVLVANAIATLDEKYRDVLILRFYGCHSYEEIAEFVRAPLGTVKSRVFYAVRSCREILKQKGVLK